MKSARLPYSVAFGTISCVSPSTAAVASSPKLLDRVRWQLRVKHYSVRTEQAYVDWIRRYILFHRKRHPNQMSEKEITEFLTHLAVRNMSPLLRKTKPSAHCFSSISKYYSENSISLMAWRGSHAHQRFRSFSHAKKPGPFWIGSWANID